MENEHHQKRHVELHKALDELVADWAAATEGLPSKSSIVELMQWSHAQTIKPDHKLELRSSPPFMANTCEPIDGPRDRFSVAGQGLKPVIRGRNILRIQPKAGPD